MKFHFLSRFFVSVYTVAAVILLLANRFFAISVAYYVRRRGYNFRNLLLVGTGRRARNFIGLISRHKEWGYRIIGVIDKDPMPAGTQVEGYKVLGAMTELPKLIDQYVVDEVVFVIPRNWGVGSGKFVSALIGLPLASPEVRR